MTSTASSSISRRMSVSGQRSPRMCSLSASPVPTPSSKRPSSSTAAVAAAWATIAGWMRTVGQVTRGRHPQRRRRGDGADHAPHERALALLVEPRMEVVGDPHPLETGLLAPSAPGEQRPWPVLLRGQEVAELDHVIASPLLLPRGMPPRPAPTVVAFHVPIANLRHVVCAAPTHRERCPCVRGAAGQRRARATSPTMPSATSRSLRLLCCDWRTRCWNAVAASQRIEPMTIPCA